ncbi:MAG TPA: ATP-binding protein, partial [Solirubrobacterales bacterium]|nr:ATP-binding protein [Solirubrobacterales bacterium]
TDHQVRIEVEDDGCGFDSSSVATGHGLIGMRERIELLGGEIEIRSEPDHGTQISAKVPLRLKG